MYATLMISFNVIYLPLVYTHIVHNVGGVCVRAYVLSLMTSYMVFFPPIGIYYFQGQGHNIYFFCSPYCIVTGANKSSTFCLFD